LGQSRLGRADSRFGRVGFPLIAADFGVQQNFAMCQQATLHTWLDMKVAAN
jgi:hypothetical protein